MDSLTPREAHRMAHAHSLLQLTLLALLTALAAAPGCLPEPKSDQATGPAPVVDADAPDAETAYWRDQYRKNRTVPPKQYSLAPKPARNNEFGEFEDDLYASLDSQPSLPRLPGGQDLMPMLGGPASYPAPASLSPHSRVGASETVAAARSSGGASSLQARSAPAGIMNGSHFYPIEQLVFGGDYPDMDKPELYRLSPRDVISVTVRDHPEFSAKLDIQADGTVRIPNTPDFIRLRGLTVDEAADEIRRNLQIYVKGECVVRVQTNRARGGYYFVFGDVNQPGRFPMGLEPVKLSDAILAANWETNPARMDEDDELGPAFPAAGPRGKFNAPASADLARVVLITPHRSQPVRTTHDIRSAMLGMTNNDPAIRPGQIIVVPSLNPRRNASLGLAAPGDADIPDANMPGRGFSGADASARLPYVGPDAHPSRRARVATASDVENNLANAYQVQANTPASEVFEEVYYDMGGVDGISGGYGAGAAEVLDVPKADAAITEQAAPAPEAVAPGPEVFEETRAMAAPERQFRGRKLPRGSVEGIESRMPNAVVVEQPPPPRRGRRLERSAPRSAETRDAGETRGVDGWNLGF